MAVKFTKPEINVREKLAELDKPSGIAGEAMLRAETPQEQQALIGVGRRNILINGAFQVWQRGTSSTQYTGSARGYIADRWSFRYATTAERATDVPSGESFKYSFKVVVASTSPDAFIIQGVEDADRFAGQTVTFSYWIKPSETCTLRDDYFRSAQGTHNLEGGVWQRVTNTFVVPSDITANEFIYIQFPANKVITFYVTGVQLELGKVATPFEHRSYGEELALCQRYFYQTWAFGVASSSLTYNPLVLYHGYATKGANTWEHHRSQTPVTMRALPTARVSDQLGAIGKMNHFTSPGGGSTAGHTPYSIYGATDGITVSDYVTGSIYGFSCQYELSAEL